MATVIIPARYGSLRFPGKPLSLIGGKSMIVRVAKRCLESKADTVAVVTDDSRIYEEVVSNNIKCFMTPENINTGTDRIAFVAKELEDDIIINVQGDEPFIPPALINQLIEQHKQYPLLKMNTACVPFNAELAEELDTSSAKVVLDNEGNAIYFSRAVIPFNRDNSECVRYKHIGVYGFKKDFLIEFSKMPMTTLEKIEKLEQLRALENGVKIKVILTNYDPISVDTPEDLELAQRYYNEKERD